MKCQNLFSEENKKYILKCSLLKFWPIVLSVKAFLRRSDQVSVN